MKTSLKIVPMDGLLDSCRERRARGERIVFTNGCFDLLHVGHVRYLEEARSRGDLLIVAVNSDSSVRTIKGPLRPVTPEGERVEVLAALQCVDYVTLFDTSDPLTLIEAIMPDVLVKGADWPLDKIVGAKTVMDAGGEVARIPLARGASTTAIIERIAARFGAARNG
ncbi:MAG: D-glycero-beta-D-manno-heptose 1-phosphate adenylyltransferase [Acidobacteriota bacterium]